MKAKEILKNKKRGGASMFIVVFTIIILSIITLSFTRLIISEATKTTNDDLSQSAYDSAMAGVEDAKIALLRYHQCLDEGYRSGNADSNVACERIVTRMEAGIRSSDCSTVQKVLGRESTEETEKGVVIQETQKSDDKGDNKSMAQAYTCVTIDEELNDYRTTLTSSSRTRIIPIRSDKTSTINRIQLNWFSSTNQAKYSETSHVSSAFCSDALYPRGGCAGGHEQAPTTIAVRLIQTDKTFNLSELSVSRTATNTDTGQLLLVPSTGGVTSIATSAWGESADKAQNNPIEVHCNSSGDWLCKVSIDLPNPFRSNERNQANTYLVVSLPYGSPDTDISLTNYSGNNLISFTGVQARVDSTGRANDLYRRVETRLELVDTYYPYPEFEITMTGDGESDINKSFTVTFNCFSANNGHGEACSNYYY